MKRYRLFALLFFALFATSCNSWLDVKPEDQLDEKDLFESGNGYRHALNGIYYGMSSRELYGEYMTWGIVEGLGQVYDWDNNFFPDDSFGKIEESADYDWDHYRVEPEIEAMWEKAYKMVANCNNLIQNIAGEDKDKFGYKELERLEIWGEALALRAFIQFDMLRLFAPSPATNPGNRVFIPYVNVYPSYVSKRLPVDSCLSHVIKDLQNARKLLWKADSGNSFSVGLRFTSNELDPDKFFNLYRRGYRLNYWAATVVLARACLYAQQPEEAYKYAKEIIEFQDKKRTLSLDVSDAEYGDIKFYNDVLWGLESLDLVEYFSLYNDLSDPDSYNHTYFQILGIKDLCFGADLKDARVGYTSNDARFTFWLSPCGDLTYDATYRFSKYENCLIQGTESKIGNKLVPLVRMSEAYYIAAEAIYKTNLDEAKKYLRTVKRGRGLEDDDVSMQNLEKATEGDFMSVLKNDARREWLGEGQIFFMYKRLNEQIPAGNGEWIPIDDSIILPVPDTETNIN